MKPWVRNGLLLTCGIVIGAGGIGYAWKRMNRPATKNYALRDDILVRGNTDLREVAFTFDDGPKPEIARELLNILGREGVRATFFVVGKQVEQHPELVRRMMNEGHEVGNHTFNHPRLDGMSPERIRAEIASCDKAILKATGARSNLFRPPGMRYDDVVIDAAQALNYVTVHWNTVARDFGKVDSSDIAERVIKNAKPGGVILLHGHPETLKALPEIIRDLRGKGYRFVTVTQMLARLPRPVFVKTNAYAAKEPVIEKAPAVKPKATVVMHRPKKRATAAVTITKPVTTPGRPPVRGVDVPSWN